MTLVSTLSIVANADQELHDQRLEIGIATSPVYFLNEDEFALGLHVHGMYLIQDTNLSIGLGYERIFDDHRHQTIGVVVGSNIWRGLTLNVNVGATFDENAISESEFALHLESTYEFSIDWFHFGPVVEWAYDPNDQHISLGLHTALHF
ncbi:MAG: hypothetical protein KDD48_07180 [Bdellovibrionales bacterium]|nr:hypothetical protein [Bdellovibrionales bacterium]